MSEAEKKWKEWDNKYNYWGADAMSSSKESREAYKAALKREIEKYHEEHGDNQGPIDYTLAKTLELLDTVEP